MPPTPARFAGAAVLTGPTASGKSALAIELALALDAEIVAVDSMTVYRGLDIGTAKPTAAERAQVPHHLLDALDPWESASVAWWLERAAEACDLIRSRGKMPLFVGGTPLYLKALTHGLFDSPPTDPAARAELEAEALAAGAAALHARLAEVDPVSAARLHPNDVRRVVRALEVFRLAGRPISGFQQTWTGATFGNAPDARPPLPTVVLDWPRELLAERIAARVDAALGAGWLAEAERLLNSPHPLSREASQALGYPDLWAVSRGEQTLAQARERIVTATRQFAKRQRTWFRSFPHAINVDARSAGLPAAVRAAWNLSEKA